MKSFSSLQEDLRKWFSKTDPAGDWKRINSKGEAIGPCAREPGEPKPKCMSRAKRESLTKKERASAVRAKRKHDPNPERKGEPINVSNFGKGKISENMENLEEKNVPTSPEKWAQAKAQAKAKFDVYPSAYANGWAAKKYKEMGGGWKSVSENVEQIEEEQSDTSEKTEMAQTQLHFIKYAAEEILEFIEMGGEIEEWYQNKLSKVQSDVESLHSYVEGESRRTGMKEEVDPAHKKILDKAKTSTPKSPKGEYDRKVEKYLKKKHGMKEEVEQIDELSKDTLNSYMGKAAKDNLTSLMKPGMIAKKHAAKRFIGMIKAGEKLAKEEIDLEEGAFSSGALKPSQKMKDLVSKIPSKSIVVNKDEKGVYTSTKVDGKEVSRKYKTDEQVELEESDDIRSHRVGDEVILKNKDYHGVIVKSKGSDISFKNKSDNKHYKATHSMIDRNISQENRYKEKSDVRNKKIDDAMTSDMKSIHKSGALKKLGIGVKEQVADAPFDPPYSKKPASQIDKTVANIRKSMNNDATPAQRSLQPNNKTMVRESRRLEIVREAMTDAKKKDQKKKIENKVEMNGSDKFQSEPELSSQIIKNNV